MAKKNGQSERAKKEAAAAAARKRNWAIIFAIVAVLVVVGIVFLYRISFEYGNGAVGMVGLLAGIFLVKKLADGVAKSKAE
jgi:hypothetical protein